MNLYVIAKTCKPLLLYKSWLNDQEWGCQITRSLYFQFFKETLYSYNPQQLQQFTFSPTVEEGFFFSMPSPTSIICNFLMIDHSGCCEVICGSDLHLSSKGNGTPLQYSCLENPMGRGPWQAAVHGVTKSRTRLSDFTFTFHFHALEKEMATHSSILALRIPGTGEPGGLPSTGSHRVGHD